MSWSKRFPMRQVPRADPHEFLDNPTMVVDDVDESALAEEVGFALWTSLEAKRDALATCKERQRRLPDMLNGITRWQVQDRKRSDGSNNEFMEKKDQEAMALFKTQLAQAGVVRVPVLDGRGAKSIFGYRIPPLDERDLVTALAGIDVPLWDLRPTSSKHSLGPVFFPDRVVTFADYGAVYNVSVHDVIDEHATHVNAWIKHRAFVDVEAGLRWAIAYPIPAAYAEEAQARREAKVYINTEGTSR